MIEREELDALLRLDPLPMHGADGRFAARKRLQRRVAQRRNRPGRNLRNLPQQPRAKQRDLLARGRAVAQASRLPRARRPVLDGVTDIDFLAPESGQLEKAVEVLPRLADKRPSLQALDRKSVV